jgi:hypothetical protein
VKKKKEKIHKCSVIIYSEHESESELHKVCKEGKKVEKRGLNYQRYKDFFYKKKPKLNRKLNPLHTLSSLDTESYSATASVNFSVSDSSTASASSCYGLVQGLVHLE